MGRVALPEMRRFRYDDSLATGAIAAGGTLGILIPPSVGFVIYAILTEESVGRLFVAGVLPGILLTLLFLPHHPDRRRARSGQGAAGPEPRNPGGGVSRPWRERRRSPASSPPPSAASTRGSSPPSRRRG